MFIFRLCDVYWISVKIRVNTVQKVKRKNMLPKYVGRFTAEVRTVFLCHRFEVSSPFRGILRRSSEAINSQLITFGGPKICKYPSNKRWCSIAQKHLPRDIFRSFERVFIRLLMSKVSSDSKVKHIHKQTFCKRYFF